MGVGGILLIPTLVWLGGLPIHQATATALFSFLFTGVAGTWMFQRRGSIDWNITLPLLAGALIFSYLGAMAKAMVNAAALELIIALIIVFAGAYILLHRRRENGGYRDGRSRGQQLLLMIVGALAGFGSGLSGAGGPLFSVPMMLVLGFFPLAAIGASQVLQIVSALSGTLGNLQFGSIDFVFAAWITLFELAGCGGGSTRCARRQRHPSAANRRGLVRADGPAHAGAHPVHGRGSGIEPYALLRGAALGRQDGVAQEHGNGHRTDAAGDGRDPAGARERRAVVHVADEFALGRAVDADIDHRRTGLDHVAADGQRLAHGCDQHVGAAGVCWARSLVCEWHSVTVAPPAAAAVRRACPRYCCARPPPPPVRAD